MIKLIHKVHAAEGGEWSNPGLKSTQRTCRFLPREITSLLCTLLSSKYTLSILPDYIIGRAYIPATCCVRRGMEQSRPKGAHAAKVLVFLCNMLVHQCTMSTHLVYFLCSVQSGDVYLLSSETSALLAIAVLSAVMLIRGQKVTRPTIEAHCASLG